MREYSTEELAAIEKAAEEKWDAHFKGWVMAGQIKTHAIPVIIECMKSDLAAQLHSKPQHWISPDTPPEHEGNVWCRIGGYSFKGRFVSFRIGAERNWWNSETEHWVGGLVDGWQELPDTNGEVREMISVEEHEQKIEVLFDCLESISKIEETDPSKGGAIFGDPTLDSKSVIYGVNVSTRIVKEIAQKALSQFKQSNSKGA